MKRVVHAGIWMLVGLLSVVFLSAQEHPPVTADAQETAAKKLYDDLAQGKKILVVDVRSAKEFAEAHVPGATNIPAEELSKRILEWKVSKDRVIVTVCEHGGRSSRAALELEKLGYKTTSFCRLDAWKKAGYKVENSEQKSQAAPGRHKFTCHHFCQSDKEVADLDEKCDCACGKPYRECRKES